MQLSRKNNTLFKVPCYACGEWTGKYSIYNDVIAGCPKCMADPESREEVRQAKIDAGKDDNEAIKERHR